MAGETMTPKERIWAAIRLEKPDRVPVCPNFTPISCAHLLGWTQAKIASDQDAALDSMLKVYDQFGPIDGVNPSILLRALWYAFGGNEGQGPGQRPT